MTAFNARTHWDTVYAAKGEAEVSWFQPTPAPSLDMLARIGAGPGASLIDVGGGASRLVDALLAAGWRDVAVLDLSAAALARAQTRLGERASLARWIVADATTWTPDRVFDVWHDRAAFHFLVEPADRAAYVGVLKRALAPGGHVILAAFAPDGPEKCSGLPVMRHDAASLARELGEGFALVEEMAHEHATPWGAIQRFRFATFRRAD
ncbi:MAG: class I SAM-dependent methyltransferase [Methylobacteriaceae bacterium]|nr:class I SAM-dependent methyltransferase [Methylobacteriaceae bacterium]